MRRTKPITKIEFNLTDKSNVNTIKLTQKLRELRRGIIGIREQKNALIKEIEDLEKTIKNAQLKRSISKVFLYGFFLKSHGQTLEENIAELKADKIGAQEELKQLTLELNIHLPLDLIEAYYNIDSSFRKLIDTSHIWHITNRFNYIMHPVINNKLQYIIAQSGIDALQKFFQKPHIFETDYYHDNPSYLRVYKAKTAVSRHYVRFSLKAFPEFSTLYRALHFVDTLGMELYCYPSFIIVMDKEGSFVIRDIEDLKMEYSTIPFVESNEQLVAPKVIDMTWAALYSYETGFREEIYKAMVVAEYGQLKVQVNNNWKVEFLVNNSTALLEFVEAFKQYQATFQLMTQS